MSKPLILALFIFLLEVCTLCVNYFKRGNGHASKRKLTFFPIVEMLRLSFKQALIRSFSLESDYDRTSFRRC